MTRYARSLLPALLVAGLLTPLAAPLRAVDAPDEGLAPITVNEPLTINALLGTVEGTPIFSDDVLIPIDADLKRFLHLSKSLDDFRPAAHDAIAKQINSIISDALIYKAAKDSISDEDKQRLDAYMNKMRKDLITQYNGSQALTEAALRARGSSIDKELAGKKRRSIIDFYLHKTLWPKISITRQEVLALYNRDLEKKYTLPTEVDLYTITLPVVRFMKEPDPTKPGETRPIKNPTADQAREATNLALEQAKVVIAKIKAGGDFAELVETYKSADGQMKNGGRWPHTRMGMLASPEIEKAAFALAPNSVAEPLLLPNDDPTLSRVVIVKVGEVTPGHIIPFAKAQDDIERKLKEEQWITLTNEYYRKLKDKAAIEALDHMTDTATDVAIARYAVK